MNKIFKYVALLEGISYLLLLFVAVPLKYWFGNEILVKILGMPHGILFIAYIMLALVLKEKNNWNFKTIVIILLASVIPLGTFYVDKKYLRKIL